MAALMGSLSIPMSFNLPMITCICLNELKGEERVLYLDKITQKIKSNKILSKFTCV
ncbi:putative signal peptide protein [Puccinia sorghi]|uniref:Putative signal peptide protein n=1 Tax=Puccinia sorghi TaxID=27349 RepID=A0A0L6VC87_9BASI|nr:putative signal peptide protein [Puccinia sorghi]